MDMGIERFTTELLALIKNSDPHVVLVTILLTFLTRRTFWPLFHIPLPWLGWFSFFVALPLTLAFSQSEEAAWGGYYLWQAWLKNGLVVVVIWLTAVVPALKKWPHFLRDDPTATNMKIPEEPPGKE